MRAEKLVSEHTEIFGRISPDGRWLLYQSDESGNMNVYVTSFPARKEKWPISENGRLLPKWSADGREIFYLSLDHTTLFAAGGRTQGDRFELSTVERLFFTPMVSGRGYSYDGSADGNRFLFVASSGETAMPLTLVVDWPSELQR